MTFRFIFSTLTLTSLMTGCGYVGSQSLSRALCLLDEDGDGVPRGGEGCDNEAIQWEQWVDGELVTRTLDGAVLDCDDSPDIVTDLLTGETFVKGQLRTPFTRDVPYDGIDNDCKGDDNVDDDNDSFPGIDQIDWKSNFEARWDDGLDQSDWPTTVLFTLDCSDLETIGGIEPGQIYPNAPFDDPYDDVDQNCNEDNDFDADGDGFASAEYSTEYKASQSYDSTQPATDCDDDRSDVKPLDAGQVITDVDDVPYDGKDKRCDDIIDDTTFQNDFDADGDGWMPYGYEEAFLLYAERYGYGKRADGANPPEGIVAQYTDLNGNLMVGDCYDSDVKPDGNIRWPLDGASPPGDFHPGHSDFPYDGFDNDCGDLSIDESGQFQVIRNDFDIDEDGYIKNNPAGKRATFVQYITRYHTFQWPDDENSTPYASALEDAFGDTSETWGEYYDEKIGDCQDVVAAGFPNPEQINPAALERLGDSINQDCDGDQSPGAGSANVDTARFNFSISDVEFDVDDVSRPVVVSADDHYMVFAHADRFQYSKTVTDESNVGLVFFLNRDEPTSEEEHLPTSNLTASGFKTWFKGGLGNIFSDEIAGVHVNGSDFTVGFSYRNASNTFLAMRQYEHNGGTSYSHTTADNEQTDFRDVVQSYTGLDFQHDPKTDYLWLVGCNSDSLHYMAVQPSTRAGSPILQTPELSQSSDDTSWDLSPSGEGCFLQGSEYVGTGNNIHINTIDNAGAIQTYFTNTSSTKPRLETSPPWAGQDLKEPYVVTNENWIVQHQSNNKLKIALDDNNEYNPPKATSTLLYQADAIVVNSGDDRVYVAAIYTSGGQRTLFLSYNDSSGTIDHVEIPLSNAFGTIEPDSVGLTADEDRVVIAVTGTGADGLGGLKSYLGWTVMGFDE